MRSNKSFRNRLKIKFYDKEVRKRWPFLWKKWSISFNIIFHFFITKEDIIIDVLTSCNPPYSILYNTVKIDRIFIIFIKPTIHVLVSKLAGGQSKIEDYKKSGFFSKQISWANFKLVLKSKWIIGEEKVFRPYCRKFYVPS